MLGAEHLSSLSLAQMSPVDGLLHGSPVAVLACLSISPPAPRQVPESQPSRWVGLQMLGRPAAKQAGKGVAVPIRAVGFRFYHSNR